MPSPRRALVAGNWKLHNGPARAGKLARQIRNGLLGRQAATEVVLCPPFVSLAVVQEILRDGDVKLGAQNAFWEESGAWTGEVAADMLRQAGCAYVILGHSERRAHFGETNATVRKRLSAVLAADLRAIVCVGETLQEREAQRTHDVVRTQLRQGLEGIATSDWPAIVVAYEPVWAIGTGKTATPQQAQEVHALLRQEIARMTDAGTASRCRILYGGSVKADNAADLFSQADIDGGLIGGASLDAQSFLRIVESAPSAG